MPVRELSTGRTGLTLFGVTLDRRQTIALVAVVAALLLALAVAAPLLLGDDTRPSGQTAPPSGRAPAATTPATAATAGGTAAPQQPAAPTATTTATPVPSAVTSAPGTTAPSTPASTTGAALPAGWRLHQDSTGFVVPVPNGWSVERQGSEVYFRENGGRGRLLIVDQTRQPKPDPVADWTQLEKDRRGTYRDYNRVKIEAVDYWDRAADWEHTRTSDRGNPLRVLKRGFITAPDQAYGITWSTSAGDWDANRDDLDVIFKGFRPARS